MNRNERLLELMGNISDRHISENEPKEVKKSRKPLYITIGAASAAVLLLVILPMTGITIDLSKKIGYFPDPGPEMLPQYTVDTRYGTVPNGDLLTEPPVTAESGDDAMPAATTAETTVGPIVTAAPTGLVPIVIDRDKLPFEYDPDAELSPIDGSGIDSGGMGFEGMYSEDWREFFGKNPWNNAYVLSELPVFTGSGIPPCFDPEKAIAKLEKIAAALGEELTDVQYSLVPPEIFEPEKRERITGKTTELTAKAGSASLSIHGDSMDIKVSIPDARVPDWWEYDVTSTEMSEKTLRYLADKYASVLGYDDYFVESKDYGYINSLVIKNSDDAFELLMNYNFCRARLRFSEIPMNSGKISVVMDIYDPLEIIECAGIYPVIDQFTAREMLLSGDYVTTVPVEMYLPDGITEEIVMGSELVYRSNRDRSYIMPYYRFIVEIAPDPVYGTPEGGKHYGGFYVPAVSPEYLTDTETNVKFN